MLREGGVADRSSESTDVPVEFCILKCGEMLMNLEYGWKWQLLIY